VVYGGSANGRILWKLPDGRTYAAWETDEITGQDESQPAALGETADIALV